MYLHSELFVRLATDSLHNSNDYKKGGERISSPNCGRGKYLYKERLKCSPIREHLPFVALVALFEIFHVSVKSEQIANAMFIKSFQFVSVLCHILV